MAFVWKRELFSIQTAIDTLTLPDPRNVHARDTNVYVLLTPALVSLRIIMHGANGFTHVLIEI